MTSAAAMGATHDRAGRRLSRPVGLGPASMPLGARRLVGLGVFVWLIVLAVASLRQEAAGPDWGVRLAPAPDGAGAVVSAVRAQGVGWQVGLRPGDRVRLVDDLDARAFVGRDLGQPDRLTVVDRLGRAREVRAREPAPTLTLSLLAAAFLFAALGVAVHRWAADPALGGIFLFCCGASASALAVIPGALMGSAWANFLAASSATAASSALATVFLWFPRRLSWARPAAAALAVGAAWLVAATAAVFLRGAGMPPRLDGMLFAWFAANLLGGAILLALRALSSADRHALAPIVVGVGLGVAPLALLSALPQAFGQRPIVPVEIAAVGASAVPLGFAYAISRHRLFALDARLRGFLVRVCAATATASLFVLVWLGLRVAGVDEQLAVVSAVAVAALAAPTLLARVEHALDAWLYPPFHLARSERLADAGEAARSVATTVAARVREIVPTRWAACLIHDSPSPDDPTAWRVVGTDGDLPPGWLDDPADAAPGRHGATIVPIERFGTRLGLIVVGPRLDGTPLGGVDVQTVRLLARSAAAPFEAALLRERAAEEARFREGLSRLARDLAAVGAAEDVLRLAAWHAAGLLSADRATVWLRDPEAGLTERGELSFGPDGPAPASQASPRRELADLVGREPAARLRRERVARGGDRPAAEDGPWLAFAVGEPDLSGALVLLSRQRGRRAFAPEDERRGREIADHAAVALERVEMSAQAAEVEALRELDRMRGELMDMLAHDLQSPLTAISGNAQRLQARADRLDPPAVAEAAGRIVGLAKRSHGLVRDLLTSTRHEHGRLALHPESLDAGQFLGRLAATYQPLPGGDRLRVDAPAGLHVSADPARLEQAIGNLLQNALRYALTGPITLCARAGGPDEVWIEVRDQGPGIPAEEQPHVWEKFYRTAGGARATRAGTGIGLWVVRTLAELHGGRAELESAPGQGSTFRIVLPREQDEARPER